MNGYIEEMHRTLQKVKENHQKVIDKLNSPTVQCMAYFSYSIALSSYKGEGDLIVGDLYIMNIGNTEMNQPILLFQIQSDSHVTFSGKFSVNEESAKQGIYDWERVKTEGDSEKEYCFKPLKVKAIPPKGQLVFSGLQIRFPASTISDLTVHGFVYFKENPKGVSAVNSIHITG